MESSNSQRSRSSFYNSGQPPSHEFESHSESLTEELGAVGGYHTVRHEHHHHHHHHVHHVQDSQRTLSEDRQRGPRRSARNRRPARQPEFSFTSNPSPPSYEEAVSGIPATSSPATGAPSAEIAIPATRLSRALPPAGPPSRAFDFPLRPQWDTADRFGDSIISSEADDFCSEDQEEMNPAIFDLLSPVGSFSPIGSLPSEDFLASAVGSPTVSELSLGSPGSNGSASSGAARQVGCITALRATARRVLLEVVNHLQQQANYTSADDAWDRLVERLCGRHGRCAQREAEILWEFAFRTHPLEHFGATLRRRGFLAHGAEDDQRDE